MPKLTSVEHLRKKVAELITLAQSVQDDIADQRDLNAEKSDRWQESDTASAWEEYLDEAEELISNIESL